MKVNDTAAKNVLQLQLMTKVFEKMAGDDEAFKLILEGLTKAMSESGSSGKNTSYKTSVEGSGDINEAISNASAKYGIDGDLIRAVIKQESDFNPYAKSSAGAEGLMQLMPGTASELGVSDSYNVDQNVDGGTQYLKKLLEMYGNSKELALAAYNAGPGALKRNGVDEVSEISNLSAETRNYVQKVMKNYGK